jgi:hypothetical protein
VIGDALTGQVRQLEKGGDGGPAARRFAHRSVVR